MVDTRLTKHPFHHYIMIRQLGLQAELRHFFTIYTHQEIKAVFQQLWQLSDSLNNLCHQSIPLAPSMSFYPDFILILS